MPIPSPADFRDRTKKHSEMREMLAQMAADVESKTDATTKADQAKAEAINHIDSIVKTNPAESLFDFKDSEKRLIASILQDGDIETAKLGKISEALNNTLVEAKTYADNEDDNVLVEAKEYADSKTKSIRKNMEFSLFDFNDSDKNTVVRILDDGDIESSNFGKISEMQASLALSKQNTYLDSSEKLFEFKDASGSTIVTITEEGDIIFNGGRSLVSELSYEDNKVARKPSKYELLEGDFNSILSGYKNISHVCDLPVPIGLHKQRFKITNKADFLNLKITQPERIKIDTPYFKDDHVVHPFLCSFHKQFRGYDHVLLLTPYNNTNDVYENPCVFGSNDLVKFELLSGMPQPIYEKFPGPHNYNSDNFAVYDHVTGEFCVGWRNGSHALGFNLWLSRTKDGRNWSEKKKIFPEGEGLMLSPNILYNHVLDKWVMYNVSNDVKGSFSGNKFNYRLSDNIEGPWSEPVPINTPPTYSPWHQEVRCCGDHFVAIINDNYNTSQLYLGISDDGINWEFSDSAAIEGEHLNSYKATIVPKVSGETVSFDIIWTSSDVGQPDTRWQLFHVETNPINISGV